MLNTGRPVDAQAAKGMGLADRVEPTGQARAAAETIARQMAEFPQIAMRADRWSALNQAGLPLAEALEREAEGADEAKRLEAAVGAARFSGGAGRGGE